MKAIKPRSLYLVWILLAVAAFAIANQNWFEVRYAFGDTTKKIISTGAAAWPQINAASWFWVIGLAGMLFTRNRVRTGLAFVLAAITATELWTFIANFGAFPPVLNAQIEKASGIAGTGAVASDAIIQSAANQGLAIAFAIAMVLMLGLQIVGALASFNWKSPAKNSKYQKQGKSKTQPNANESKGDSISLWDSQR